MPTPAASDTPSALKRTLGPIDGAALVISNVIGVGIFITPGVVAGLVPHPLAFLGVWLVGGLLALIGALAYAELAALVPFSGGEYLYLSRAFGPLAGFLTGWTSFVAGFSGAIAASAMGFAIYLGRFFPSLSDASPLLSVPLGPGSFHVTTRTLVAVGVILSVAVVHRWGLHAGRRFQNLLTGGCLLAIGILLVFGFGLVPEPADAPPESAPIRPSAALLALIPVMFTYSGWNAAVYVAEEVRDPRRNVLKALLLGTGAVVAVYLLLNGLFLRTLSMDLLADTVEVGDAVASVLFGPTGAVVLTPLILLALASSVSAMTMAGPRIYYAMARDGVFPRAFGRLHAQFETPSFAITAQALWSTLLVLTGSFDALLIYTGFAVVLFAGVAVASLFVLRRQSPLPPEGRPAVFGYRILPAVFIAISLALLLNALYSSPVPSAAGLVVIGSGVPLYLWLKTRRPSSGPPPNDPPVPPAVSQP